MPTNKETKSKKRTELKQTEIAFKTPYNADQFPTDDEVNNDPSETLPDQTLSLRDIINRHARGLSTDNVKTPLYEETADDGEFFPDPRTLDLAERQELKEQYQEELDQIKKDRQRQANRNQVKKDLDSITNPKPKDNAAGTLPTTDPSNKDPK